jgi:hypothetical protein
MFPATKIGQEPSQIVNNEAKARGKHFASNEVDSLAPVSELFADYQSTKVFDAFCI